MSRPRSADVDDAILRAAINLFAEGGLTAATFDRVAKSSGVSRAAIYRRWDSPQPMVAAALAELRHASERSFFDWTKRPLDEVVVWFVKYGPRLMLDPFHRALLRQVAALGPEASELKTIYKSAIVEPWRAVFSALINRARATRALAKGLDADLIQDMLSGALLHHLLLGADHETEAMLRAYVVRLLKSLGLMGSADVRRPSRKPRR